MVPTERVVSLLFLRKLWSIFCVLFLTLLAQQIVCVITYNWKELLDIRAAVIHQHYQHYDQEYDFPKADPLFAPPRAIKLIPEANPKQRWQKRGTRSSLLVWFRRRTHHPPLLSILLANVQSQENKVYEIRVRVSFQRDISDCSILCFPETWLSRDILSDSVQPSGFSVHRADRN